MTTLNQGGPRRLLLLGGSGQVGRALRTRLLTNPTAWAVDAPPSSRLPLTDPATISAYVAASRPDVIVNSAAFTRVDDAERDATLATRVNTEGPGVLAQAAAAAGAQLVHLSTDYVFDGRSGAPYAPDAATAPLGVYGRTKRDGEVAVLAACPSALVVRTAWVHSATPPNFVATAVRHLRQGATMRVVDDQVGTPTRADNLAGVLEAVLTRRGDASIDPLECQYEGWSGVVHATDAGAASWYDVACAVLERLIERGAAPPEAGVVPVPTTEVPRPAPRPAVALLDCHATWARLGRTPPHWRDGVRASVDELLAAAE